jgi:hypothetical protein
MANSMRFRNWNRGIGQRRSANGAQSVVAHHEPVSDSQAVADCNERSSLAVFGSLPVADVDRGHIKIADCEGGTDTGVHASAEQNDGAR